MEVYFISTFATLYCWNNLHSLQDRMCSVASVMSDSLQPMDCSPLGSSVHGILQARIPKWIAMPSSRGSSWSRNWAHISGISCIADRFFTHWATREAPYRICHFKIWVTKLMLSWFFFKDFIIYIVLCCNLICNL